MSRYAATRCAQPGCVRLWDVFSQQWTHRAASNVPDRILATLDDADRELIARLAETDSDDFPDWGEYVARKAGEI